MSDNPTLREYLEGFSKMGSRLHAFLLKEGRHWIPHENTFSGPRKPQGYCFMNCTKMALEGKHFTYCEGLVLTMGIPIDHAWLCDRDGEIWDPTLRDSPDFRVTEYWGIPFTREYLTQALFQNQVYGILGGMSDACRELVDGRVKNFKEKVT